MQFSTEFIRKYFLLTFLVLLCVSVFTANYGADQLIKGSDFVSLYSGALITQLDSSKLYDFEFQRQVQNTYWGELLKGEVLPFVYPPYVALILSPITLVNPLVAKFGFIMLNFILLYFFLVRLCHTINNSDESKIGFWSLYACLASLLPQFSSILSGQTTPLILFLLIFFISGFQKSNKEIVTGIFLGLLAIKPQYYFICFLFVSCVGRFKIALVSLLVLIAFYAATACILRDSFWPDGYLEAIVRYLPLEYHYNGDKKISLFRIFDCAPNDQSYRMVFMLSILYIVGISKIYGSKALTILPTLLNLCSPHSMYYDFGIGLMSFLLCIPLMNNYIRILFTLHVILMVSFPIMEIKNYSLVCLGIILSIHLMSLSLVRRITDEVRNA